MQRGGRCRVRTRRRGVPRSSIPAHPYIKNLNTLLHDIYIRYIALSEEEFEKYYRVVDSIFQQMHEKMKYVDPCYYRNSSTVQYAGSHPDHLRINKPNEFDIDIVIDLPLNKSEHPLHPEDSDFIIQPQDPGFIQLNMGVQYQCLPRRFKHNWKEQAAAYRWSDRRNYLLRSKFMDWFKGVVNSALNEFYDEYVGSPVFEVDGEEYTAQISEGGPAMTLYIASLNPAKKIKIDVDLVPALRFPVDRWPISSGYRNLPISAHQHPSQKSSDYFMAVPKPNRRRRTERDRSRSWRLAMPEQERILLHDTRNMRQAIRLMKKFRDAQHMDKIASYFIKTMFFWEAVKYRDDKEFWNQNPACLFQYMLKKFYKYLNVGYLPYFWHPGNNLFDEIDKSTLKGYLRKVRKLLKILDRPEKYKQVARFLLTRRELKRYIRYLYGSPEL